MIEQLSPMPRTHHGYGTGLRGVLFRVEDRDAFEDGIRVKKNERRSIDLALPLDRQQGAASEL